MALTQDTILTFLLERGGRVRNADLLSRFRSHLTDPAGNPQRQQHNRDAFKALVNGVAVVRRVDGVNFVVVKKRYRDFAKEEEEDTTSTGTGADPDPSSSPRTAAASPHGAAAATRGRTEPGSSSDLSGTRNRDDDAVRHHHSDVSGAQKSAVPPVGTDNETSLKVLNISSDRVGRTGESGAVISVNSPPPRDPDYTTPERRRPPLRVQSLALTAPVPTRFGPTGPLERTRRSAAAQSCENLAALNGSPAAAVRPQTRRGGDDPPSESVPLDPVGHEWLVKSGAGMWRHVYGLLLLDARLATRRDFMSGFTALHWAAKGGNGDMVRKMMDVSGGNGGARLDVNGKTHGGYTPLHIAAIHGHGDVMALLVQGYGARVNVRDNAGKRPHHYLGTRGTAELKELLGAGGTGGRQPACRDQAAGMEEEEEEEGGGGYREQPKGLNSTISRLFQPHHIMGHRKKHQRQQQQPGSAIWDGF